MEELEKDMFLSPVGDYCGVSAGIIFTNGVGYTNDKNAKEWLIENGYSLIERNEQPPLEEQLPLEEQTQLPINKKKSIAKGK